MAQMQIFLSHSSKDKAFADQLVAALRGAGADVWYDEHNLGAGVLRREINQQLANRPIVIVVISKAALTSQWVQDECEWAYNLYRRKPERLILPVVAAPYDLDDLDQILFLESLKRVEAPGNKPFPPAEAIAHTLRLLELTPAGHRPAPVALPQQAESVDDLLAKGKALMAQKKYAEAIPFFERAARLDPRSFNAWGNLGTVYAEAAREQDAPAAYDKAIALDPNDAVIWSNKAFVLRDLKRPQEALAAYDRALALDPNNAVNWRSKGLILRALKRPQEALAAYDRGLGLDPNDAVAWRSKGLAFSDLHRHQDELAAYEKALRLDPNDAATWSNKGAAFSELHRYPDALAAYDRALALDPNSAAAWSNKAVLLRTLGLTKEALAAYDQSLGLDPNNAITWSNKAVLLRALGLTKEAKEAERRAKALGG